MKRRKSTGKLVGKLLRIDGVDLFIGNYFDEAEGSVCLYYEGSFTYYESNKEREGVILSDSDFSIYNLKVAERRKEKVIVLELITDREVNECLKAHMRDIPRKN